MSYRGCDLRKDRFGINPMSIAISPLVRLKSPENVTKVLFFDTKVVDFVIGVA